LTQTTTTKSCLFAIFQYLINLTIFFIATLLVEALYVVFNFLDISFPAAKVNFQQKSNITLQCSNLDFVCPGKNILYFSAIRNTTTHPPPPPRG
jgi:hypothetical protein